MLSYRLLKIASLVNKNDVIYDVGTDHGLLPCYLMSNNLCKKAYAIDNKQGPLDKCIENIEHYNLKDKVIPMLSNGIDDISDDVTTVIIAGMGFYTLKEILDNKDLSNKRFIIQINKNIYEFRKYLSDHSYRIINEEVVYDDFYYVIIEFTSEKGDSLTFDEMHFGPILMKKRSEDYIKYLKFQKNILENNNMKYFDPYNEKLIETINHILSL